MENEPEIVIAKCYYYPVDNDYVFTIIFTFLVRLSLSTVHRTGVLDNGAVLRCM